MASEYDKIHSNPVRVRILELIHGMPRTQEELIEEADTSRRHVIYHTKVLEDADQIQQVEPDGGDGPDVCGPSYEARCG